MAKTHLFSASAIGCVKEDSIFLLETGCLLSESTFLVNGETDWIDGFTTLHPTKIIQKLLVSLLCAR